MEHVEKTGLSFCRTMVYNFSTNIVTDSFLEENLEENLR